MELRTCERGSDRWECASPSRFRRRVVRWGGILHVLVALLLVSGIPALAQQSPLVEAHVSADSVKIGERFTVALIAEHAGETDVVFPPPDAGPALFDDLEVIRRGGVHVRRVEDGRRIDSVAYEVTTFALDSVRVPPLPIRLAESSNTNEASTSPHTVQVTSVVDADAEGLRDSVALATFPRSLWTWIVLGLGVTVLLAGAVYGWWRHQTHRASSSRPAETNRTPYEEAALQLRQLQQRDLADPEGLKPFYDELANVLRIYLARELGLSALERTSEELFDALERRSDVPTETVKHVRAVLERADLAKFADVRLSADENRTALRKAWAALESIEEAPRIETPNPAEETLSP